MSFGVGMPRSVTKVLAVVAVIVVVSLGFLIVLGSTVERPTTGQGTQTEAKQANPTQANYESCLQVEVLKNASVDRAMSACESQRPDSLSKKSECMTYVTMRGARESYAS